MVTQTPNPLKPIIDAFSNASVEEQKSIRVIGVMGLTGTGKSTFIKKLTGDHSIVVGDDLLSRNEPPKINILSYLLNLEVRNCGSLPIEDELHRFEQSIL